MKRLMFCLSLSFVLVSCAPASADSSLPGAPSPFLAEPLQEIPAPPVLPQDYGIRLVPDSTVSYAATRAATERLRSGLRRNTPSPDSLSRAFTDALLNGIIPYWYGTPWSFGGHTSKPGVGQVACGYFVSTTLAHLGLNVNRYRLAQRSPLREAQSLALGEEIIGVNESVTAAAIHQIDSLTSEGIYFIGFDQSHVGYLLKRGGELFVLHSDYTSAFGVRVEPIGESVAFGLFERFQLVPLSGNQILLQRWLSGAEVAVLAE